MGRDYAHEALRTVLSAQEGPSSHRLLISPDGKVLLILWMLEMLTYPRAQ